MRPARVRGLTRAAACVLPQRAAGLPFVPYYYGPKRGFAAAAEDEEGEDIGADEEEIDEAEMEKRWKQAQSKRAEEFAMALRDEIDEAPEWMKNFAEALQKTELPPKFRLKTKPDEPGIDEKELAKVLEEVDEFYFRTFEYAPTLVPESYRPITKKAEVRSLLDMQRREQMNKLEEEYTAARKRELEKALRQFNFIIHVDDGRHVRVTQGVRVVSFSTFIVAGNGHGVAAFGRGKGATPEQAFEKAKADLINNMVMIPLAPDGCLFSDCVGYHNGTKVIITRRRPGSGMRTSGFMFEVLWAFGIRNAAAKVYGRNHPYNIVYAVFDALRKQQSWREHALSRGLHMYRAPEPGLTWSPVIPTAEELKRESERVQQIIREVNESVASGPSEHELKRMKEDEDRQALFKNIQATMETPVPDGSDDIPDPAPTSWPLWHTRDWANFIFRHPDHYKVYYRIKSKSSNVDYHPFSMVDSATSRASIAAKPTPYTAKAASVSFKAVPNAPSS